MIRLLVILTLTFALVSGCNKSDESLTNKAGAKVGETVTDFAKGIGKGIDKQMAVEVELSQGLADQGVSATIAKAVGMGGKKAVAVYLLASKPFKGTLIAKAMNREGLEIGRSLADVELAAADAKYITFSFNDEMDVQLVTKYLVDIK